MLRRPYESPGHQHHAPRSHDGKSSGSRPHRPAGEPYIDPVADLTILLVEDDLAIGRALRTALEGQGYVVTWCQRGHEAVAAALPVTFSLVLLDLGLPDLDGVEVCRRLRAGGKRSTIVMLTARSTEADVVAGLDAGADDYLTKPVRLAELLARVRAHVRRDSTPSGASVTSGPVIVGSLEIDVAARRVLVDGSEIALRPKEFDLLTLLATEAGHALTRERIMNEVWDEHWFGSTKTLDMQISSLRRRLGEHVTITTLRGVGYRLELAP